MSDDSKKNDNKIKGHARHGAPSAGVWTRIGLLFSALCLAKIFLLLTFRRYLFEIHWRTGTVTQSWFNEAAFYMFALLVGVEFVGL